MKLKIGVMMDQPLHSGGGHQQSINAIVAMSECTIDIADLYCFTTHEPNLKILASYGFKVTFIKLSFVRKILLRIRRGIEHPLLLRILKQFSKFNSFEKNLIEDGIDLMYFPAPDEVAADLEYLNYITTVWDLSHRDEVEFPEIRSNRIFEGREKHYRRVLPKAMAIFVDSSTGRDLVAARYGIDLNRIFVVPFSPAPSINAKLEKKTFCVRDKYTITSDYVYYPSQFWAHKNHVYVIDGICRLEEIYGVKISIVFTGGDKGNLQFVKKYASSKKIKDRIHFLGFVPNEDIPSLYKQSLALVMPSYFGPTNLPPLEAFSLGVPVLYSDLPGLRDQVGNAALLLDLDSPDSLAHHLYVLMHDQALRDLMVSNGRIRLSELRPDYFATFSTILKSFIQKRRCWGSY